MEYLDYDFIGFTYNGVHSIRDLGVFRVSSNGRYEDNLLPNIKENTASVPGMDGQYFLGTTVESKSIPIQIAFEGLTETKFHKLKELFSTNKVHDLVFDEAPYKVYSAKVSGKPNIKYMCFERKGVRFYSGNASISFTCFHPYARTPELSLPTNTSAFIPVRYKLGQLQDSEQVQVACGLFFKKGETLTLSLASGQGYVKDIILLCLDDTGKSFTINPTGDSITLDQDLFITNILYNFNKIYNKTTQTFNFQPKIYSNATKTEYSLSTIGDTEQECFLCNKLSGETLLGKCANCYDIINYPNKQQWCWSAGLPGGSSKTNNGQVPSTFIVTVKNNTSSKITVTTKVENENNTSWGKIAFTIDPYCTITWDSRLGLLKQTDTDGKEKVQAYQGTIWGSIPAGEQAILSYEADKSGIEAKLEYNYWYY